MTRTICLNEVNPKITGRVLRGAAGIGMAAAALSGYWSHPLALFALLSASIYVTTSAIIGRGLWDGLIKPSTAADPGNVTIPERTARGVTAAAVMGAIVSGTLVLDAADVFMLMLAGVYAAASAITAWDPLRALFDAGPDAAPVDAGLRKAIPATVGQTGLAGVGQAAEQDAA